MANKSKVVQPKSVTGNHDSDPAEYLFRQNKFHDCHLTVGIPGSKEIEKIPVVTSHLVAHSTVFRDMLLDSNLADPTGENTHITDVRPEIFKLMLTFLYKCHLSELKTISRDIVLELALCADKYNIKELLRKVCKRLIPSTVEEVFAALRFVVFVDCPSLITSVTNIIQKQTGKVVKDKQFLELDDNCIEFIAKQETLSITELQLWKNLVRWANHNAQRSKMSCRTLLKKALLHVRLATFTVQQIVEEVKPTNILTDHELLEVITTISVNKVLNVDGLCSSQVVRKCSQRTCRYCFEYIETSGNCSNCGSYSY